jgi:integrase
MAALKLTKSIIENIELPATKPVIRYDAEVPGFHVKIYPTGRRVFAIGYRTKAQRKATYTIGPFGPLTLPQARDLAKHVLLTVAVGGDPAQQRHAAKVAPTISELCDRYLSEHVAIHNKASTARDARRIVEARIRPAFGQKRVSDLARSDIKKWHQSMKPMPHEANRSLAYLSKMMSLASKDWGLRSDNPVLGLARYPEARRERYLTADEFRRLGSALAQADKLGVETPAVIAAIRLLVLTGCRHSEIKTLRWQHVDLQGACLRLPDSKTGAKVVHLASSAVSVLAAIPRDPKNPYVIPGSVPGKHFVNLQKAWIRFRAEAGLPDVRLHDLRHSFASIGVASGMGLPIIGKILGHAQHATTQKYAHLSADPIRLATEKIADEIATAMSGTK